MNSNQQFSSLVYEYFLLCFQSRYYLYGDRLPTIDILCREFGVSSQTIKAAYKRLRTEGYITIQPGKPAMVSFMQTETDASQFIAGYYERRLKAFPDLYLSGGLFFLPMLAEGLRRMTEEELSFLSRLAQRANAEDLVQFYCCALQKMDNPLALSLFWESSMFHGFSFARKYINTELYDADAIRGRLLSAISCTRKKDWELLYQRLLSFHSYTLGQLKGFISRQAGSIPAAKQIPFTWNICRERPQIRYSLASRILQEIYFGVYCGAKLLPSYEKLAQTFGVSVSTARHTVNLLNQIGITQTVNGVGTRIFSIHERCNEPDFTSSSVRQILSLFVQSFELIIYSCEEVLSGVLNALPPKEKEALIVQLQENLGLDRCGFSLWHVLTCITCCSPLAGVREIYGKIYGLSLWGHPLKASQEMTPELSQMERQFTKTFLGHLKNDDVKCCAACMKEHISWIFPMAVRYLSLHGIRPEELRMTPSIRLIVTEQDKTQL